MSSIVSFGTAAGSPHFGQIANGESDSKSVPQKQLTRNYFTADMTQRSEAS